MRKNQVQQRKPRNASKADQARTILAQRDRLHRAADSWDAAPGVTDTDHVKASGIRYAAQLLDEAAYDLSPSAYTAWAGQYLTRPDKETA